MGSEFRSETFPFCSRKALETAYADWCEHDLYERGRDPYSGSLGNNATGLQFVGSFKDERSAHDYVEAHHQKHDRAMAALIGDESKAFENTATGKRLKARIEELQREVDGYEGAILARVKAGKSKSRGCGDCGSSIAVGAIRKQIPVALYPQNIVISRSLERGSLLNCPVCGGREKFIETDTDRKRLASLKERLKKASDQFEAGLHKHNIKHPAPYWFVGGFAAS